MASPRESPLLNHQQIDATFKGLFEHLTTEQPFNDKNMVIKLLKTLTENQRLKKEVDLRQQNTLSALELIRKALKNDDKTRLLIKGWLESARPNYVPRFNTREDIEGVKTLLSTMDDEKMEDSSSATAWLKKLLKKPIPEFDETSPNILQSFFGSIYEQINKGRNKAVLHEYKIENWRDIKDRLKEYMISEKAQKILPPIKVLKDCDIGVPKWEDYVKNEEIFNDKIVVSLPYVSKMLKINIRVLKYPDKQEVHFYCKEADDETIEICLFNGKFVAVVPFGTYSKTTSRKKRLEADIAKLKVSIEVLKDKILHMAVTCEDERNEKERLNKELIKQQETLEILKKKLKLLEEELKMKDEETKKAMLRLAEEFHTRYVKNNDDENGSDDCDNY